MTSGIPETGTSEGLAGSSRLDPGQDPPSSRRLECRWALLLVVAALALRVCNLGMFSLWLDEVFTLHFASGTLRQTLDACAGDAENLPMYALAVNLGQRLGLGEHTLRLIPVTLGVLSIVLLAGWVSRHLGQRAALLTGLYCALSPFHIRYSQELRGYPFLLFFVAVSLVAVDVLGSRPRASTALLLGASLTLGLYSHLLFPLVLVPLAYLVWTADDDAEVAAKTGRRRRVLFFGAAVSGAGLFFLPWLVRIARELVGRMARPDEGWSLRLLLDRWQFLTCAAREGDRFDGAGALVLAVVAVGAWTAARSRAGRGVLVGVLTGSVVWELVLLAVNHWSDARYDMVAWPFLAVLVGLGLSTLFGVARGIVGVTVCGVFVLVLLHAVDTYQRIGRPSWDRFAEVVRLVRQPDEPLLVENDHLAVVLRHYLGSDEPRLVPRVASTGNDLVAAWPADRAAVVVLGRSPRSEALWRALAQVPWVVEYFNTARLYRIPPQVRERLYEGGMTALGRGRPSGAWPDAMQRCLPERLDGQPGSCFGRMSRSLFPQVHLHRPPVPRRLEFDQRTTAGALLSGWSGFETTPEGVTFAWATGFEAGVTLFVHAPTDFVLRIRMWCFPGLRVAQHVRGILNDRALGVVEVGREPSTIEVPVPKELWRPGRNLLVLQFATCAAPADVNPQSRDGRPLAVAVDWIEVGGSSVAR